MLGCLIFIAKLIRFRVDEVIEACFWVCHMAFPESIKPGERSESEWAQTQGLKPEKKKKKQVM